MKSKLFIVALIATAALAVFSGWYLDRPEPSMDVSFGWVADDNGIAAAAPEFSAFHIGGEEVLKITGNGHAIFVDEFAPGRFVIVVETKK